MKSDPNRAGGHPQQGDEQAAFSVARDHP